ncbi:MAG: ABC transporter permease [Sedimentisphaerales bacterium]|nr:ABC transporter permease [Sedimentisphaerales bacterium]
MAGPLALQAIINRAFIRFHAAVLTACWWALWIASFLCAVLYGSIFSPVYYARIVWFVTAHGSQVAVVIAVAITLVVMLMTYLIMRRGMGVDISVCFFCLRYLCKRRIVFLIVAAVALSVCMLVVVASLFTGFIETYERSAVELLGDVVLLAPGGYPIPRYPQLIEHLEQADFVEAATAAIDGDGLLNLDIGRGNVRPVKIWGIDPVSRARVSPFKTALVRQKDLPGEPSWGVPEHPGEVGGYVGIGVMADPNETTDEYDTAAILRDAIGSRAVITTGTFASTADPQETPRPKRVAFRIADVVFAGVYELDSTFVYVPISALQEALYPDANEPVAETISIRLKAGVDSQAALTQLHARWDAFAEQQLGWGPGLRGATDIVTALEMQRDYVAEFRKQMAVLLVVFGVISFSAVVLVFCIFYMIVRLKQRDIAIIKSCGAASVSVAWIFLGFGVTVGVTGAGLGTALGYVITRNINAIEGWIRAVFGLKLWSGSVYMFSHIPNQMNWGWTVLFVGLAVGAAALGALLPALLAAATRPVEVLRYE